MAKKTKRYRLSDIMRAIAREADVPHVATCATYTAKECARRNLPFDGMARDLFVSLPAALGEPQQQWGEKDAAYVERMAQAAVREARRLGVPMVECGP
jgi:hypothetical protein